MKAESGNGGTSIGVSSLPRLGVNLQDLGQGVEDQKADDTKLLSLISG